MSMYVSATQGTASGVGTLLLHLPRVRVTITQRHFGYRVVVPLSENVCPNSVQCPKILAAVRPKSVQSWVCPKVVQKFKMLCFAVLKGG